MRRAYTILDVFTSAPLTGNPLAVVADAEGLDPGQMQAIAREFNLSETVFVLPAENPLHSARVRIFTPSRELPFAGHPTVGTAVLLAQGEGGAEEGERDAMLVLEEAVGPIRCGVTLRGGIGRAVFDVPRLPEQADGAGAEAAAAALGLARAEICFENHQPTCFSCGNPFHFVPVRNLATLQRAAPQTALWQPAFGDSGAYVYTRESIGVGHRFHARCFVPTLGIGEDPATGSAAAAFAGVVHTFDALPGGWHTLAIEQGYEIGRPSLITLEIEIEASQLRQARVGGDAVIVARGHIDVG
jgi:trans-2,3-dihydro-3-hydroxyanthranilate isomerase